MPTDIVIAQTTIDDEGRAEALALGAVEARLAACAHVDPPVKAVYRWQGAVQVEREWRITYKTARDRLPALAEWVASEHPYEVPEWIVLPVDGGSEAYLRWVAEESADA
ncbi:MULTISPECIES: divalent-cation tolerance protein CutA [Streptomyces]|uniref:Divalent-cation tolerance protein CutA n=1 Tax=Streptomyces tsukubensis (strain DSM 42081 / NBRC 108919 / NRRL 18488 / 9993) TaxID=1114943 RepID=I2MYY9_STRT9|nr:divalent-cation tolerance protein CutA [Streptomyces tsukubensis]MYS66344.1 divalent cation tolerance protein CutA [Streptomyces sp. SID5473]AZK94279.1 divalent-cation tolerance protein CutA [Streptomyces tsukubensis]EIF89986.1 CutA1 divalent ion tolerance protein [Streptomyces tsukubensis NRRL18488]QKM69625.1 divalent-cation tolerance protein CutA [Streptomyces tsukubensis NRRL18488]TAI46413.1 divalent-cation tolerance protein CutA [Streptomyces tsukubensis]